MKQASRNLRPELEVHIKEEIRKLLNVDFIKAIHHPTCIIPVKQNGQIETASIFAISRKHVRKTNFFCQK